MTTPTTTIRTAKPASSRSGAIRAATADPTNEPAVPNAPKTRPFPTWTFPARACGTTASRAVTPTTTSDPAVAS